MSRKKSNPRNTPAYEGERSPFAMRLKSEMELHGMTQQNVADTVGVQRQTVSLYTKGQALPDISTLDVIADLFGVSTDYLLGRCETKTTNLKIKATCDYVGLSEKAVDTLNKMSMDNMTNPYLEILSNLISHNDFVEFLSDVRKSFILATEAEIFKKKEEDKWNDYVSDDELYNESVYTSEANYFAGLTGKRNISIRDLSKIHQVWAIESLESALSELKDKYIENYFVEKMKNALPE